MVPRSLLQSSRALVQGTSPTNNQRQTTLPCLSTGQRQPDTSNPEGFRKHHEGGRGAKDFIPGFIAKNSVSAYQILLADTTTCKISSLQMIIERSQVVSFTQSKGWPALKHVPSTRASEEGGELRFTGICHYLLPTIKCK